MRCSFINDCVSESVLEHNSIIDIRKSAAAYFERREMEEEILISIDQKNCDHWRHRKYTERNFDVLNGFEIIIIRCCNCHKRLQMTVKGLAKT